MTIGAGLLSVFNGAQGVLFGGELQYAVDTGFPLFAACGAIFILFGVLAVSGGVMALMGKHFSLALLGSFLGMMGGGLYGFWLGLTAIIVFAFSDADF